MNIYICKNRFQEDIVTVHTEVFDIFGTAKQVTVKQSSTVVGSQLFPISNASHLCKQLKFYSNFGLSAMLEKLSKPPELSVRSKYPLPNRLSASVASRSRPSPPDSLGCAYPMPSCLTVCFQSPDTQAWQNDYLQGTGCEMYTETLAPSFTGMTFPQASE